MMLVDGYTPLAAKMAPLETGFILLGVELVGGPAFRFDMRPSEIRETLAEIEPHLAELEPSMEKRRFRAGRMLLRSLLRVADGVVLTKSEQNVVQHLMAWSCMQSPLAAEALAGAVGAADQFCLVFEIDDRAERFSVNQMVRSSTWQSTTRH